MLLHGSPSSPLVRKVPVPAHESGLLDRIEPRHATMPPVSPGAA